MNDPHVESLTYRMEAKPGVVTFENPPPLAQETHALRLRLNGSILTVEMKEHFGTVQEARTRVESYLRDWTLFAALDFDSIPMDFIFENAHQIDRNPSPRIPGQVTGQAHLMVGAATMQAYATFTPPTRKEFPKPPSLFKASPDVETMWARYRQHVEDKEPLTSMAYACLTMFEGSTGLMGHKGARAEAARKYNVDFVVLKTLGEITSVKGGPEEARKFDAGAKRIPLTDAERRWVRKAVKRIILRKAEYDCDPAGGASLPQITLADLPKL